MPPAFVDETLPKYRCTLSDVPPKHRVNVRLAEIDGKDEILVEQASPPPEPTSP